MKSNCIKQAVDTHYSEVDITPQLRNSILNDTIYTETTVVTKSSARPKRRRWVAVLAACVCVFILSIPVFGAISEPYNRMLSYFSNDLAQLLMPVDASASAEFNDIRIDVVSAFTDGYSIFAELNVTDISGRARLEEGLCLMGGTAGTYVSYTAVDKYSPKTCHIYWYMLSSENIDPTNIELFFDGIFFESSKNYISGEKVEDDTWKTGEWNLSFAASMESTKKLQAVTANDQQFYDIKISPLAIYVKSDTNVDLDDFNIEIHLIDGQTHVFNLPTQQDNFMVSETDSGNVYHASLFFGQLFALSEIAFVSINGESTSFA